MTISYRSQPTVRRRARPWYAWLIVPAAGFLGSCGGASDESGASGSVPVMSRMQALMTGAVTDSFAGTPTLRPYSATIAQYSFQIEAQSGSNFLGIWGEPSTACRPPVGTYPLTEWLMGIPEQRVHATLWREVPGGNAQYYSVSGTLTITESAAAGVVGTFDFDGAPGYILSDRAVLSPSLPHTSVRGTFSVRPEPGISGCVG